MGAVSFPATDITGERRLQHCRKNASDQVPTVFYIRLAWSMVTCTSQLNLLIANRPNNNRPNNRHNNKLLIGLIIYVA